MVSQVIPKEMNYLSGYVVFFSVVTFLNIMVLLSFLKNKRHLDARRRNFNILILILGGIVMVYLAVGLVIKLTG